MKKTLLASLLVLTLASPVLAAPAVTGGFQGPTAGAGSTTVAEARFWWILMMNWSMAAW